MRAIGVVRVWAISAVRVRVEKTISVVVVLLGQLVLLGVSVVIAIVELFGCSIDCEGNSSC